MSVVRQGTLGATRTCPHCKATVLQSANICPGCQHHLRFSAANSEPQSEGVPAMRVEGSIHHPGRGEACEYCVVVSITNEQGERFLVAPRAGGLSRRIRHFSTRSMRVCGNASAYPSWTMCRRLPAISSRLPAG
jgi:hypothetical protein